MLTVVGERDLTPFAAVVMRSVSRFVKVTFLKRTAVGKATAGKSRIVAKYEFKGKHTLEGLTGISDTLYMKAV